MKQIARHILIFSACVAMASCLSGCLKDTIKELSDINGVEVRPGASVPLLAMDIGIKQLYNTYSDKGSFVEGGDRFLSFVLANRDSIPEKQFLALPAISLDYSMSMDPASVAQFNAIGQYHNSFSNYSVLKVANKEQIKRIGIKEGRFDMFITSEFKHNITMVFTYPSITKYGIPLVDTVSLLYTGRSPVIVQKNIDLAGYDVNFDDGGISYNVIPYLFEIDLQKIPGNNVSTKERIIINEKINVARYKYLYGYLGKFPILNFTDNSSLDLFDKQVDGSIFFRDPKIKFTVHNSFGMPVTAKISNLRVLRGNGEFLAAGIDLFKDTFTFPYPASGRPEDIVRTSYQVDSTNTGHPGASLAQLFNAGPQRVLYDVEFWANYSENIQDNMLYDNSLFYTDSELELPMELSVKNYVIADVEDNDLPDNNVDVTVEWAKLSVFAHNQLPMSGQLQVYYGYDSVVNSLDTFYVQDSLYMNPGYLPVQPMFYIQPANLKADGKVDMAGVSTVHTTYVSADRYAVLSKYKKAMIRVKLNTPPTNPNQPPYVKLYADQQLNVRMGAECRFMYKTPKEKQ